MKHIVLTFLFMISLTVIYSQEPLKHEKRVYISPEGKFYIQRSLPIYLRLATSPEDNAPSFLLHSEKTVKYSNPMYLDSEGYNTIRSPWAVDPKTMKAFG